MKEMEYLMPYDSFKFVKARSLHTCYICGENIKVGEKYISYLERSTGFQRKACIKHYEENKIKVWQKKRAECEEKLNNGNYIHIETDASGPSGERWAFVIFKVESNNEVEIYRDRGLTPPDINSITLAEGFAVLKAIEWLQRSKNSIVHFNLPILISNDNFAVSRKLETGSERGMSQAIWSKLNEMLDPYREEARLFLGGTSFEAHNYAQKLIN